MWTYSPSELRTSMLGPRRHPKCLLSPSAAWCHLALEQNVKYPGLYMCLCGPKQPESEFKFSDCRLGSFCARRQPMLSLGAPHCHRCFLDTLAGTGQGVERRGRAGRHSYFVIPPILTSRTPWLIPRGHLPADLLLPTLSLPTKAKLGLGR